MNQIIQKLKTHHVEMEKEKAIKKFGLTELANYKGKKVAFFEESNVYQWAVFNNDNDWDWVLEYGTSGLLENQLDKEMIEYFSNHKDLWKENNW
jgi:hypothetical protein